MNDPRTATCVACGKQAPRDDMFGADPELLCEACAHRLRERLTPKATGRLASVFAGRPTPVTVAILAVSAALFVAEYVVYKGNWKLYPDWLWMLMPAGPTGSIVTGEWWRLITTALLHGGFIHILFNSLWIWALGRAVEGTRGSLLFLLIFLGSAAFASAAQLYFGRGAGVGLSGVLYALAGYLWMRRGEDAVAASVMNPGTSRMLGAWLVICFFLPMGIANGAHVGGLVWGLAAGWVSTQTGSRRAGGMAALAILTIAAAAWVTTGHHLP